MGINHSDRSYYDLYGINSTTRVKVAAMTNTLVYNSVALVTTVKSSMVQPPV
jgi:hypothetical protein